MLKQLLTLALVIGAIAGAKAQQDTLKRSSTWFPVPVVGYSIEKGFEFGGVVLYSFYTDAKMPSPLTRNSSFKFESTYSTKKHFKIDLKSNIWTGDNAYHFKGQLRFHNNLVDFYGIGDTSRHVYRSKIKNKRYKLQLEAEKKLFPHFYGGISFLYQHDAFSSEDSLGLYPQMALTDKEGGYFAALGLSAIYDNRDNQNYTSQGQYLRLNVARAPGFLSKHPLTILEIDGRTFHSLWKNGIIGLNGHFETLQGDELPFYLLPKMGNDMLMRGYYSGRLRNQNYLAFQTEYRHFIDPKIRIKIAFLDLQPKFALAAFAGVGSVYENKHFETDRFKPNYGLGIRYFFEEESKLTVRLDYGWGEKLPGEKRQGGFYISFGEAF